MLNMYIYQTMVMMTSGFEESKCVGKYSIVQGNTWGQR